MADNYEMPYMDTNKPRDNIQKNTSLPGYVSYSMVLLMFVLMLLTAVVLAVGTGILVYFVAGSYKECKFVFPENYVPNTGEQKGTDTLMDSATDGDTSTTNGDTSTETPEETSIASLQNSITRYAAGSHNTHSGGMATTICLPTDPQWGNFNGGQYTTHIYGAEYENSEELKSIFGKDLNDEGVPCAVCQTRGRLNQMMIPARTKCMDGWFIEYIGYLMTEYYDHHRSDVKCVDKDPESLVDRSANVNGVLLYFVTATGQIPNPPYIRGRELTCVVCSK